MNYVFQGPPGSTVAAPGTTIAPAVGIDTVNLVTYASVGNGWQPETPSTMQKFDATAQAANITTKTIYTVPANQAGEYLVSVYVSAINTATGGTLPSATVGFTDQDSTHANTIVSNASASTSATGTNSSGVVQVNAAASSVISIATGSYAAGSGTALQYNIHVRITYLG